MEYYEILQLTFCGHFFIIPPVIELSQALEWSEMLRESVTVMLPMGR